MKESFLIAVIAAMSILLAGCATGQPREWVDVSTRGTNYTEDYIYNVSIRIADGQRTGIGIARVNEFSRGGTSGNECCASIPGVGQTIKVIWHVGGRQEDESQWRTYSRDVVVIGAMPRNTQKHSVLLVRFFPDREIEAELLPGDGDFGPANPRMDRLFFAGPRVMRHKGE
ncbi:DUF3304 domain-containing protein [Cupriavidus metallidurans]|uniref:DUF3304 domain-containing protein n=1 Tax=Cupriavidus metallidurans TaxID=119219 RepID=UPI0016455CF0|nr:DUF3304 domain-containing protein [Cupriavidus metallidurans]